MMRTTILMINVFVSTLFTIMIMISIIVIVIVISFLLLLIMMIIQAVNTKELMKSFGWDTMDAFTQHDAQELNRILCDKVEEHLKGSAMDGSIKRLFEGEMENYIECIDVDYKSRRNETFYDIQLNIKSERGEEYAII